MARRWALPPLFVGPPLLTRRGGELEVPALSHAAVLELAPMLLARLGGKRPLLLDLGAAAELSMRDTGGGCDADRDTPLEGGDADGFTVPYPPILGPCCNKDVYTSAPAPLSVSNVKCDALGLVSWVVVVVAASNVLCGILGDASGLAVLRCRGRL
jgi:hypothetical protein